MKIYLLLIWFIVLSWVEMFGQDVEEVKGQQMLGTLLDSASIRSILPSPPDTLRVKMLVTLKSTSRAIAFTLDGYQVGGVYLDDRERVLKGYDVWQVKIQDKKQ